MIAVQKKISSDLLHTCIRAIQKMAGVYKQVIRSLRLETNNSLIIGVIINSLRMKIFEVKNTRFNPGQRAVWTFTLRDSEQDFINVTVWGSVGYVQSLSSNFHIGYVVEVINPKVLARHTDDRNEPFVPSVSSPYSLTVNEGASHIQMHDSPNQVKYEALLRLPTKNVSQLLSLNVVLNNIERMSNQYIDLLVAVSFVGETRNIVTRNGKAMLCRDFIVTDGSCEATVHMQLWEDEWIKKAAFWETRQTILCLADAYIGFNQFKKKNVISIVRKTIITENPNIPQASDVRAIVRRRPEYSPPNPFAVPNPDNITTVMTIQQILEKLNQTKADNKGRAQFTTVVYATVNEMNLNADANLLSQKCAICKRTVPNDSDSCMNLECPSGNGTRVPLNVVAINLKLNLKDHTGYLIGCTLTGVAAERALQCSATQFQAMSFDQRNELKWKYLLERCDVRLQIICPTIEWPRVRYNVLSIRRIQQNATAEDISILGETHSNY